jgi:hypothetical protein
MTTGASIGAGAVSICLNFGSLLSFGAFGSPLQQQETVTSAKAVMANAVRIRIML